MQLTGESFKQACREGGALLEAWLRAFDREYAAPLYREAARATGSWQSGEDVVQDSLIKIWLRCSTYQGPASPMAWIRQIVRRTVLDHLDRRQPESPLVNDEGELLPEVEAAVAAQSLERQPTPESELTARQIEDLYRECFARFAAECPLHAHVLRLVVDEGLGNAEIEKLLDRSPGATREFISQCRKKARLYLEPWYRLVGARRDPGPAGGRKE